MQKQKIVIIVGPTAVGKTSLSIALAKKFNGEIISADSSQVYTGLDIGSAKISKAEMQNIVHHLIDEVSPFDSFNSDTFAKLAKQKIDEINAKNKLPIIVGGTMLYVQSLLFENGVKCGIDKEYRAELESLAKEHGNEYLHNMLKQVDEASANQIHVNHVSRIIRALEIYKLTGKKKSEQKTSEHSDYDYLLIGLNIDRETLYARINARVDLMLENGLVNEVKQLISKGLTLDNQCMQGIGYKECYMYLTNRISYEECVEKIKQHSRNYAKRQITFMKKMKGIYMLEPDQNIIIQKVEEFING